MKEFINKVQSDLNRLQSTLQKEGDDLIKRVKAATDKKNLDRAYEEVEKQMSAKLKKFEPAMQKFFTAIEKNAARAGIDLSDLETRVRTTANRAAAYAGVSTGRARSTNVRKKKVGRKKTTTAKKKAVKKTAKKVARTAKKDT